VHGLGSGTIVDTTAGISYGHGGGAGTIVNAVTGLNFTVGVSSSRGYFFRHSGTLGLPNPFGQNVLGQTSVYGAHGQLNALTQINATTTQPLLLLGEESIVKRHYDEFAFALASNWDERGARAVSEDTVKLAHSILDRYATDTEPSEVAPGRDGSLSFIWDDADNHVYIDIGPNDTIHLYYDLEGNSKWEAVSVAGDQEMLALFANALQFARSTRPVASQFLQCIDLSRQGLMAA